jgi:hypothetical protein
MGAESTLIIHTPKVQYPWIGDSETHWQPCTKISRSQALDNAESYAMLSLGKFTQPLNNQKHADE